MGSVFALKIKNCCLTTKHTSLSTLHCASSRETPACLMGKVSQLESMVKVLQEDLKKVRFYLLAWKTGRTCNNLSMWQLIKIHLWFCSTRRRMLRRRCRHRLKACGRTTSAWWRSPTAPRPSWRSSRSGSSTPSTWTSRYPQAPALTTFPEQCQHGPRPSLTNSWVLVPTEDCFVPGGTERGVGEKEQRDKCPIFDQHAFHHWNPQKKTKKKKTSACPAGSKVVPHGRDSETLELS